MRGNAKAASFARGRIVAAAGRAGVAFDPGRLRLSTGRDDGGELLLVADGMPTGYREEDAAEVFRSASFALCLDLQAGRGCATVWTTDLTHDYVSINAHYRT